MIERQLDKMTNRQKEDRKTIGQNDRQDNWRGQKATSPRVRYANSNLRRQIRR